MGHALIAPGEVSENPPARRIRERGEGSIQLSGGIFNHLVNYLAESFECANIFYNLQKPDLGLCFAGLPILKRIDNV